MLVIKNLNLYLSKDLRLIIKDFNFSLYKNQKVAIIGEEGNGKSSLLKAIYDKKLIEDYIELSGKIFKDNEIIGYLPQSLSEEILNLSTSDYIEEFKRNFIFDYSNYYKLMSELDFPEERILNDNMIKDLSGGEKIKFQLLIELMKNPTILLLDEPSNDLDLKSIIWLENFIKNLDIPILFISHDENLLENCANTIIHLEQIMRKSEPRHNIVNLKYSEYITNRENYINKQTSLAFKEKEIFDAKIERYKKIYNRVQHEITNTKNDLVGKNLKDKMSTVKSMGKRFEKEKENLTKKPDFEESIVFSLSEDINIPKGKQILDFKLDKLSIDNIILSKNIELKIIGPEKICIIGDNGSGKTTLIKEILKEIKKSKIPYGYMPQDYRDLIKKDMNAIEFLSNSYDKEEHTRISTYLGSLNFKREEMYHPISELSGGQKAKLYFAKMTLNKAKILILDEPTRNLSPLSEPEIREALKNYKGCIIAVSHDRRFIEYVFDKIYLLDKNGIKLFKL